MCEVHEHLPRATKPPGSMEPVSCHDISEMLLWELSSQREWLAGASLDEPTVRADALGAIVPFRRPGVVLMHNAVLLRPPVQRTHEDDQAKHPPGDGDLHTEE